MFLKKCVLNKIIPVRYPKKYIFAALNQMHYLCLKLQIALRRLSWTN